MIFLIDFISMTVFKAKWGFNSVNINAFYTGDCFKAECISTGMHLVIDVLSALLLRVSNMCMQLLAVSTRPEIHRAHNGFYWLDIRVPSSRNLKYISRERLTVWVILGLSSIPLRFLLVNDVLRATRIRSARLADYRRYNLAVFPTLASNSFSWVAVIPSFVDGALWRLNATQDTLNNRGHGQVLGLVWEGARQCCNP